MFLYRWHGKPTEIGFGSARDVTLARARELAAQARAKLAEGINPRDARKPSDGATFGECADRVIEAMRPSWRNSKHAAQWEMTLRDYAAPLRRLPVDKITTDDVLSVLKPLWNDKPETASRLRGRIERVLDAAKAQGLRSGENPARWRGHLDQLLPKRQRLTRGHHAAMPYADVPAFMSRLANAPGHCGAGARICHPTAARSGEVLGARWEEFDLDRAVWTVPATRMKAGREHRVPLSRRALKIVKAMHETRDGDFVFPGQKPGKPLSVMALEMVLRRMKIDDVTVHGFRSIVSRLGVGMHQFHQRSVRSGPRTCDREQGRGSLSAGATCSKNVEDLWTHGRPIAPLRSLPKSSLLGESNNRIELDYLLRSSRTIRWSRVATARQCVRKANDAVTWENLLLRLRVSSPRHFREPSQTNEWSNIKNQ